MKYISCISHSEITEQFAKKLFWKELQSQFEEKKLIQSNILTLLKYFETKPISFNW